MYIIEALGILSVILAIVLGWNLIVACLFDAVKLDEHLSKAVEAVFYKKYRGVFLSLKTLAAALSGYLVVSMSLLPLSNVPTIGPNEVWSIFVFVVMSLGLMALTILTMGNTLFSQLNWAIGAGRLPKIIGTVVSVRQGPHSYGMFLTIKEDDDDNEPREFYLCPEDAAHFLPSRYISTDAVVYYRQADDNTLNIVYLTPIK